MNAFNNEKIKGNIMSKNNIFQCFLKGNSKGFIEELDKFSQIKEMSQEKKANFVFMIAIAVTFIIPMGISSLLEIIFPSIIREIPLIVGLCIGIWMSIVSLKIIVRIKKPNIDALIKERQSKN